LRGGVDPSESLAIVRESLDVALALVKRRVVYMRRVELTVDPAHHTDRSHAIRFAGAGPVGDPVQRVERGVVGSECLRAHRAAAQGYEQRRQKADDEAVPHPVILTDTIRRKLTH
jgi:hypothetical protein